MKKGFTLIEMIATVVIISITSIIIILGINSVKEKEKEKEWNQTVNRITSAADVYLENNSDIKKEIYNTGVLKYVSIIEITEAGFLDEKKLIDARDNTSIFDKAEDGYDKVKVYLNNNDSLEIEYPSKSSKYILFDSKIIYAYLGEKIDCLKGVNVYDENNNKVDLKIIDDIKVKNSNYKVVNNIVSFEEMGEYELVYAIGNNSYTRKVKVLSVEDVYYTEVGEYTHTITASGNYKITVSGAQGVKGGKGGTIIGKITLTKGTILNLVVGGQNALYGGGVGESNGGDSSRVSLNGEVIMIGAGGGGGASGTAGGSGNGGGGADQGNGAGNSGTTGGGDGASYNYTYLNECYTGSPNECVGGYKNGSCQTYNSCVNNSCSCKTRNSCASSSCGCKTYRSCVNSNCSCDVMFPRPSTKCKTYDSCRHKVCGCQTYNSCANDSCSCKTRNSCANSSCGCKTYNQVWDSCKSTQNTCESKTITTNGKSGNGGTNLISALLTNVNNTAGNNSQNGKIIIEYIK